MPLRWVSGRDIQNMPYNEILGKESLKNQERTTFHLICLSTPSSAFLGIRIHITENISRIITNIFKERLHVTGYNWKMMPHDIKDLYWQEFQV